MKTIKVFTEFNHRWRVHKGNRLVDIFNPDPNYMSVISYRMDSYNPRHYRVRVYRWSS